MLKKAPFEPKDIDLNDVVREAIEFLSALAIAREVNIRGYISPMPLPISGDRIQLQQVILNVIVNAMDAMSNMANAAPAPTEEFTPQTVTVTAHVNALFNLK